MRVLHVVPTYFPAVRYGGPIVSVHGLCAAIAAKGHDVHVFTTSVDGPGDLAVPLGTPVEMDGVKVWYFPSPWLRRLYWSPAMSRALRRDIATFDVLHTHSVFLWPTWAAARSARARGVPYVVSPRGMLVKEFIRRKSRRIKKAWIALIERKNLDMARVLHATSTTEAGELRDMGFRSRVAVIPNGIAPPAESFEYGMPAHVREFLDGTSQFILFVGRINWEKGIDRLIRALALVPNVRLVLAGNDEERFAQQLKALAQAEGVHERVLFAGPVAGDAKRSLYRDATLLVLPSYSENFGNVVLEAMAEGCAVVVTPEVGAAEIVTEVGCGLVASGDAPSLSAAIRQLLAESNTREEMGRRGKESIERRFSWGQVAEQMLAVYDSIIVDARGAR